MLNCTIKGLCKFENFDVMTKQNVILTVLASLHHFFYFVSIS